MTAAVVALGLVVALLSVLVVGLLRSHAEILRALHELGAGVYTDEARAEPNALPGPEGRVSTGRHDEVSGVGPGGGPLAVSLVGVERPTFLAFLSSGCLTCRPAWEALSTDELVLPGGARPIVVTKGPHEESEASVAAFAGTSVVTIMSSDAWVDFQVPGSPYFVLVGADGLVIGEGTAGTWDRVIELMGQALADADLSAEPRRARSRTGQERLEDAEAALRRAGVGPGHPSLYGGEAPADPITANDRSS